jgi:L-fuconolactonase
VPQLLKDVHERPFARIVISHLGNPKVVGGDVVRGAAVLALASEENIHVQLSGLSMFCEYPHSALDTLISDVVRQFGPRRLLWGSNFPVCGDIQAYRRDLALVQSGAWGLDPDAVDWVTGRAAERLWFN